MSARADTHSKIIGYFLWIFGFTGSHRLYFGRPASGTIWFDFWTLSSQVSDENRGLAGR